MDADQELEVLARLIQGKPLTGLGLGVRNGRIDLTGLLIPDPAITKRISTEFGDVDVLSGVMKIEKVDWRSLDFTGSRLNGLRFLRCAIRDCVFDECNCREWKVWGTTVSDTTFRLVDLRRAVLGGVEEGRRNTFQGVSFVATDLRQTIYEAAEFVGCAFKDARLDKVDFQTSTFTDCTFEGELRGVLFYRRGFRGEAFPNNEMERVDFSRAKLRWVEFRGLDLDDVRFPEDEDHIVLENYPETLDRLLDALKGRTDLASKSLAAILGNKRKWAGPKQRRGVLNKDDLREIAGEEGLDSLLKLIALCRG